MNVLQRREKPVSRKEGLVIQELPNEILVYDLSADRAHCLNQTAAAIWKFCDGENTVADISRLVGKRFGGAPLDEDLIWLALDQLSEKSLLSSSAATPNFGDRTRRELIKRVGRTAIVALPIVASLIAPTAASAGSTCAATSCTCKRTAACPGVAGTDPDCSCNSFNGMVSSCPSGCNCGCSIPAGSPAGTACSSNCG
jgi:hypothetical protein